MPQIKQDPRFKTDGYYLMHVASSGCPLVVNARPIRDWDKFIKFAIEFVKSDRYHIFADILFWMEIRRGKPGVAEFDIHDLDECGDVGIGTAHAYACAHCQNLRERKRLSSVP